MAEMKGFKSRSRRVGRIPAKEIKIEEQAIKYLNRKFKNTGYIALIFHKDRPPTDGDTITFMDKYIATWQTLKS